MELVVIITFQPPLNYNCCKIGIKPASKRAIVAKTGNSMDGEKGLDLATAFHEAGHAVVALILGRPVHRVTILPDRDHLGQCEFRKGQIKATDDWLEREMLIALAGLAAEACHTGKYAWGHSSRDILYAQNLAIQRAGEKRADKLTRRVLSKVEHLLSDAGHWRAVTLIAEELMKTGVISGRAATHFFEMGLRE